MQGGGVSGRQNFTGDPNCGRCPCVWSGAWNLPAGVRMGQTKNLFSDEEGVEDSNDPPPVVLQVMLMKCPHSLYDSWKEYEFGFSGFKPAKDWTSLERGKDHFKFYKMNIL